MIKLGDVCNVKSGKRLPKNSSFSNTKTNHPYIKISNIDDIKNNLLKNIHYIDDELYD